MMDKKWALDWLEFALVTILIAVVAVVIVTLLGSALGEIFSQFIGWLING